VVSELLEDVSLETIAEKDLMKSTQGKERRGFDRNNFSAIHETQLLLVLVLVLVLVLTLSFQLRGLVGTTTQKDSKLMPCRYFSPIG
jgi:hypothetical protein